MNTAKAYEKKNPAPPGHFKTGLTLLAVVRVLDQLLNYRR